MSPEEFEQRVTIMGQFYLATQWSSLSNPSPQEQSTRALPWGNALVSPSQSPGTECYEHNINLKMVPNLCNPCRFHSHLPHPPGFPKTKTLKPICWQGGLFPAPPWASIPGSACCPRPGSCSLTPNPPPALTSCVCSPAHSHQQTSQTNQHIISTNTEGLIERPEPLGLGLRLQHSLDLPCPGSAASC